MDKMKLKKMGLIFKDYLIENFNFGKIRELIILNI